MAGDLPGNGETFFANVRVPRANLIGRGVLPLQFMDGEGADTLGLSGKEVFDIEGHADAAAATVNVTATPDGGEAIMLVRSLLAEYSQM